MKHIWRQEGAEQVVRGLENSIIVSILVTLITMLVVVPLSYTFGRLDFPHKNKLFFAVLFSVALPPISIVLPFYILYLELGLAGTRLGLIIINFISHHSHGNVDDDRLL